jgi:Ca2+-binding RTX toxin-like protein
VIGRLVLAGAVALAVAAPARADITLTRTTTADGPTYTTSDDTGVPETTKLIVDLPILGVRPVFPQRVQDGQKYTFTTTDTSNATVPAACMWQAAGKTIVCQDGGGTDADVAAATLNGNVGDDHLTVAFTGGGNLTKVSLNGGPDNDVLTGTPLADGMSGGGGIDTISCNDSFHNRAAATGVTVDLTAQTGCDSGEALGLVENAIGSTHNDTITGSTGPNRLEGLAGDDAISGGDGADVIVPGPGADTVTEAAGVGTKDTLSFDDGRTTGVTVDLATLATAAGDTGDTATGTIENLTGSPGADTLTGDAGPNVIAAGGGDDVVRGKQGDDDLDGGAGTDQLHFDGEGRTAGVTADIGATFGSDGDPAESDTGFEQLFGTEFADTLTGGEDANVIDPGAGVDTVQALGGDDEIHAADGEVDTIDCGAGADTGPFDLDDALSNCDQAEPTPTEEPTETPTEEPTEEPTAEPTETPDVPVDRVKAKLHAKFAVKPHFTKVTKLGVGLPDGGGKIAVGCQAPKHHASSCAFTTRTVRDPNFGTVSIKGLFKHRKLAPGTVVVIVVTGPHVRTTEFELVVRAGKPPRRS